MPDYTTLFMVAGAMWSYCMFNRYARLLHPALPGFVSWLWIFAGFVALSILTTGCDAETCWPGGDGLDVARVHAGLPAEGWPEPTEGGCQTGSSAPDDRL